MTWLVSKASWKPKIKWKQETQESWVWSLSQKYLLEQEMTLHSSILACKDLDTTKQWAHTQTQGKD